MLAGWLPWVGWSALLWPRLSHPPTLHTASRSGCLPCLRLGREQYGMAWQQIDKKKKMAGGWCGGVRAALRYQFSRLHVWRARYM